MKKKLSWYRIFFRVIALILIPTLVIGVLQRILTPKYVSSIPEGSMIAEYYDSPKNTDVLILGDCEVYENISNVAMYQNYGVTSYTRGSSEQLIWQSYYLLEDTLQYQKPKVVILNVLALSEAEAKSEAYNRMTLDGMRWSKSKRASYEESKTSKENLLSYYFPILRYHSRWSELSSEDFKYAFEKKPLVTSNGYLMQVGVRPVTTVPKTMPLSDYDFSQRNMDYLDKIRQLCEDHGAQLLLMKAPSIFPHWYDEWDAQVVDYAKAHNITYLNMVKDAEKIGIDYSKDTFDYGQHLNVDGSEKVAKYLGEILKTRYNVEDRRNDPTYSTYWNDLSKRYDEEKAAKTKAWESSNAK